MTSASSTPTTPKKHLSIAVYCSSSDRVDAEYQKVAIELGKFLAEKGHSLVYGGAKVGLMGKLADSYLEHGGKRLVGVIPKAIEDLPGVVHHNLTHKFTTNTIHNRINIFYDNADVVVVLPGGLGTVQEAMDALLHKQLRVFDKPIIFINTKKHWDPLLKFFEMASDRKFMSKTHMRLYTTVNSISDVSEALSTQLEGHQYEERWWEKEEAAPKKGDTKAA